MENESGQRDTGNADIIPEKAIRLARRVAGLPAGKEAMRYTFDVVMLPDGTWWLDVERQRRMERLGGDS